MRLVVQRVNSASIKVDGVLKGSIGKGLVVYLGINKEDDLSKVDKAVSKMLKLGFFDDSEGRIKLSVVDEDLEILIVPNFTLYAMSKKGTKLSFDYSARSEVAIPIYQAFVEKAKSEYSKIITGEFRTHMNILAEADGPVNVVLDF